MQHLPLFARLDGRKCLVVGGGGVGARKVRLLLAAGAEVTVASQTLTAELGELLKGGKIRHVQGIPGSADSVPGAAEGVSGAGDGEPGAGDGVSGASGGGPGFSGAESGSGGADFGNGNGHFGVGDLDPYWLIIAATSNRELNAAVARAAESAHRFCNVVDDPELGNVIMPAIVDRAPVTVAVSTGGTSPVLARWLKGRIESMLPASLGAFARLAGRWRTRVRDGIGDPDQRRRFWERVLESRVPESVYAGRGAEAEAALDRMLAEWHSNNPGKAGEAWLVGAGPGRADLITLRGRQLLSQAEVVLYDRLVGPEVLEFARRDAELISVAKRPRKPSIKQPDINAMLIKHVRAGKRVCRLKGGDPMIFGRGGEEVEALVEAGLPFQVVPGVSAAQGCACYAGIPLTLRGAAQSVVLTTGHTERGIAEVSEFSPGQTLALYMGVAKYPILAERLIQRGYDRQTPVAVVERGTADDQRVICTILERLGEASETHAIESPALLFVGETSQFAREHGWFAPDRLIVHP